MARTQPRARAGAPLPEVEQRELPLRQLLEGMAAYNPRRMSEHEAGQLERSLREFGLVQPIVWNARTQRVVGGHQRILALQRIGADRAQVSIVHLDETRERVLNVKLNRVHGEWDWPKLTALVHDLEASAIGTAQELGFTEDELKALDSAGHLLDVELRRARDGLALMRSSPIEEPPDEEPPETLAPATVVSRRGDVWQVGRHRIVCGDSTRAETRAAAIAGGQLQLVLTDPPYAIFGSSTGVSSEVTDDRIVRPFFEQLLRACQELLPTFGHAYVCCDWRSWPSIWDAAKVTGMAPKNLIVWDKGGNGRGSSYSNTYELVGFLAKMPKPQSMGGDMPAGARVVYRPNLVRFPKVHGEEREHNAAKPVDLFAELIRNSSDRDGLVLDLFMGSGTVLLAAEKEGRSAAAIDVEGKWCDVAARRFQRATGIEAQLVAAGEGFQTCRPRLFSEVAAERAAP